MERSHLTDDQEFYNKGNIFSDLEKQKEALRKWEHTYNFKRPHQALGYLTPMQFYKLWKKDKEKAYAITEKWQEYLKKQSIRLAKARRIKRKEQIYEAKLQLIDCQLCSVA